MSAPRSRAPKGAPAHAHDEACAALFREWQRYETVVAAPGDRFSAEERLSAARERDMFDRQLRALGCSAEVRRKLERGARTR